MRVLSMMALTTFLSVPAALAGQSQQEIRKQCTSDDPDRSISGCTTLIQSSRETGTNLANAFYSRGLAYARKHDYDHANQDFDQALRLNPHLAIASLERGLACTYTTTRFRITTRQCD